MAANRLTFRTVALVLLWLGLLVGVVWPEGKDRPHAGRVVKLRSTASAGERGVETDFMERHLGSLHAQAVRARPGQALARAAMSDLLTGGSTGRPGQEDDLAHDESESAMADDDRVLQRRQELDTLVAGEPLDIDWSKAAQADIVAAMADASLRGSQLVAAVCRATLCRIETRHADEGSFERFLDRFPVALAWDTDGFTHIRRDQDGRITAVAYYSRHGHPLPRAD